MGQSSRAILIRLSQAVTDDQKAREREAHRKLFELRGQTIDALGSALEAVAKTQAEMAKLYQADNDADEESC
jgi:hypothetical protein